jgi:hypothetical protein
MAPTSAAPVHLLLLSPLPYSRSSFPSMQGSDEKLVEARVIAGEESTQAMPMLASSPGKGTPMLPWGGIPRPIMETLRPCRASE